MNVNLVRSKEYDNKEFTDVVDFLNSFEGPIKFVVKGSLYEYKDSDYDIEQLTSDRFYESRLTQDACFSMIMSIPESRKVSRWPDLFAKCRHYRKKENIPEGELTILLTAIANEYNWFSALDTLDRKNGFVHTNEWEYFVNCASTFPVAYLVASSVLQSFMFNDEASANRAIHHTALGCMNDFCEDKRQVLLKLRTADVCGECMALLDGRLDSICVQQLLNIFEGVRVRTLFSHSFRQNLKPGFLRITPKSKIILADYGNIEMRLTPLEKTLYFFYLNHPDGVMLHNLVDHREELVKIYSRVATTGLLAEIHNRVNTLVNTNDNSASEKMAKIRAKFILAIGKDLADHYVIQGPNGEKKCISLDRSLVLNEMGEQKLLA